MSLSAHPTILRLRHQLARPRIHDHETVSLSPQWPSQAEDALSQLDDLLSQSNLTLSAEDDVQIVIACAPFVHEQPWSSENARRSADKILRRYTKPPVALVQAILSEHVKPAFRANVHPGLNVSTGRRLPAPVGGPLAQQDYLENQLWKQDPALVDLISWCLSHTESPAYEHLWPLIVPPVMTLLDDYEVDYKIHGVLLTEILLTHAHPELLKRTGVGDLIFSSMKKCMSFLHNPRTPALLRVAVPTSVLLIRTTTSVGSRQQFNQLCEILGDGVIGSVWMYGSSEPDTIEASLETLPVLIEALGVGIARYLKAVIPQLLHPLQVSSESPVATSVRLQLLSVRALCRVIECCPERMAHWKAAILDGIARLWVGLADSNEDAAGESRELQRAIQDAASALARACPSVVTDEFGFAGLVRVDAGLFLPLVSGTTDVRAFGGSG